MAYSNQIREEELKNKVGEDWFHDFDTTPIIGDIDFCVATMSADDSEVISFLWAEAKKGDRSIVDESFAQLIITIGKARTFEKYLPPKFIGAFDSKKISFIPYDSIQEIFYASDFNWNVTPSDHTSKEFGVVLNMVRASKAQYKYEFDFARDAKELKRFISSNFRSGKKLIAKIKISKNNFVVIYQKWLTDVKPSIAIDWDIMKNNGIFDHDFFLADLLSIEDVSIIHKLNVLLKKTKYIFDRKIETSGAFTESSAEFNDDQKAHIKFWNKYERPPKKEYWNYIIDRKDLLVPQDIRERQGSYFTPQKWVELSQEYLAAELGEDWQDEYYIWDCAAGTGNLLNGLSNKYRIWASTLNQADVDVMKARIDNGANLLADHVFQFDFLNDPFDKLPTRLKEIINSEESRKKLVIYINPPYAEAGDSKQIYGSGKNKTDVAVSHTIYKRYIDKIGIAGRELFALFLIRIYNEIPSSVLANFSKLKNLQAPNFREFRTSFRAKLRRIFLVPANTFDNVKGQFPIGFFIWRTAESEVFEDIQADVYNSDGEKTGIKTILCYDQCKGNIGNWVNKRRDDNNPFKIGFMSNGRNDFQNQKLVYFMNLKSQMPTPRGWWITPNNLLIIAIFVAVRHSIEANWLNDRDQFLFPDNTDFDGLFISDCLAYSIFSAANTIQSAISTNHWIPFTEEEVGARDCFKSHFMTDFISGKTRPKNEDDLFSEEWGENEPLQFSEEAKALFDAGRELWIYYHTQPDSNPDASLYDIKMYFQGTKTLKNGKIQMKSDSDDEKYISLIKELRERLKVLADKIKPKIYEYGFLK